MTVEAGWRVPDGGENGIWAKAHGSSTYYNSTYDSAKKGFNFSGDFGESSLYGTRFRAKEDMMMEISSMSVYTAAIGRALLLPDLHERIFCTHTTLVAQLIQ